MSDLPKVIALGFFDGVHLGHGALLRRTVWEARRRGAVPAVFTFAQPPKEVVTGVPCPTLNTPEERSELMRRLYGIEEVIVAPFDRAMMTTPWEAYITEILVKEHRAVHLVAGHDHRFGHKNQGNPALLREKCAALGLGCDVIPAVTLEGLTVSSTLIRTLVEEGQMERAAKFLGHPHILTGVVGHGRGLGSARLFPTANLTVRPHVLLPGRGVYAARAVLPGGGSFAAVTNIGTRPTVKNGEDVTVEAWLPDFDGDLYGQAVRLEFLGRLRDEKPFESVEALRSQIRSDADAAKRFFDGRP